MAQVKVHRTQPLLDMTPMVDLAFLLVTFFMLTTKFVPEEPLAVDTPTSVSEVKLPDTDILTISISREGTVFFNMDGKYNRQELLSKIGKKYNVNFTPEEIQKFSVMSSFGLPVGNLKEFLALDGDARKRVRQTGIPCDSLHNELADWIVLSRMTNPKLRIAIKGDRDSRYPAVRDVINTLIENKVNRFNLITNLEQRES
ncbi:MAG: biopolymer transporter ExbD [Cyclobacteriaceae bacterium]|jgi:biopolymer transport protein ExbD|nr:biopolymer transporter ExbD [Cyclobacteriaceae bacterium]